MSTIGAGWKEKDKNGNPFIKWSIDKALLPLTIDSTKRLAAFPVKDKKSDKSPDFILNLYIPEEQAKEDNEFEL